MSELSAEISIGGKKMLDIDDKVAKATEAIREMQKNRQLMKALQTIREGKGDKATLKVLCKELDALEEKILLEKPKRGRQIPETGSTPQRDRVMKQTCLSSRSISGYHFFS